MNVKAGEIWFFDAKGEGNVHGQLDRIYEFEILEVYQSTLRIEILKDSYYPELVGERCIKDINWLRDPCYKKKLIYHNQYWAKLNE